MLRVDSFFSVLLLLVPIAFLSCCFFLYFISFLYHFLRVASFFILSLKNLFVLSIRLFFPVHCYSPDVPNWRLDVSTFTRASFAPAIDPTCPFDFYFAYRVCRCVGLDFPVAKLTYWFYLIFSFGFALLPSTMSLSSSLYLFYAFCHSRFLFPLRVESS